MSNDQTEREKLISDLSDACECSDMVEQERRADGNFGSVGKCLYCRARAALDGGAVSRSDVALEELINAAEKAFDLLYQFGCSAAADRLDAAIVAARGNAPYFHSLDRSHPAETPTDKLVSDFSVALKSKLNAAREKYGHEDEAWQDTGWKAELLEQLHDHLIKGDPRDVAAYCAFAWYHQWSITPQRDGGAVSQDVRGALCDMLAIARPQNEIERECVSSAKAALRAQQPSSERDIPKPAEVERISDMSVRVRFLSCAEAGRFAAFLASRQEKSK